MHDNARQNPLHTLRLRRAFNRLGKAGALTAAGLVAASCSNVPDAEDVTPANMGLLHFSPRNNVLTDSSGKPALLNYFAPSHDRELRLSIATRVPVEFQAGQPIGNYLGQISTSTRTKEIFTANKQGEKCADSPQEEKSCDVVQEQATGAETHYYHGNLDIEHQFTPILADNVQKIRAFADRFAAMTGIPVTVGYDLDNPSIIFAGMNHAARQYQGDIKEVRPYAVISSPPHAQNSANPSSKPGFVIVGGRWNNGGDRKEWDIQEYISQSLGFEPGNENWLALRSQLRAAGLDVPELNPGDHIYELEKSLPQPAGLPNGVIVASKGGNTLIATQENDTIVAEAGLCGASSTNSWFEGGNRYCIAEGNIAVVKGEGGDDFILASRGGAQQIDGGAGQNRIALFNVQDGDKTILSSSGGENTLVLDSSLIRYEGVRVEAQGHDLVISLTIGNGGQPDARVILPNQLDPSATTPVSRMDIVDRGGEVITGFSTQGMDVQAWSARMTEAVGQVTAHNDRQTATAIRDWRTRITNEQPIQIHHPL